jgi:hypothetical protein
MEKNRQYLYEYQNGKRKRGIGFLQVETKTDMCTLVVYAKAMDEIVGIQFQRQDGTTYLGRWREDEEPDIVIAEEIDEYVTPSDVVYEKISRQDLSRLPRREWKLANNSFLLHGFYNYHHLLYIEESGEIWVGVPGVGHEKEKVAANTFGFTEFRRIADVNIELQEEEQNVFDDFGYWCKKIESR